MRWAKPIIAIVCIVLAVWQVRLLMAALGGRQKPPSVETAAVSKEPFVVGITREGTLESANVAPIRAPESGSRITWIVDDGIEVKAGDLIAKVDVSEYRFEVDRQRLEYEQSAAGIEQARRNSTRDSESAQMEVEKTLRAMGVLSRSQLTETEQADAQIGYDRWTLNFAETDLSKQERLAAARVVPKTTVDLAERKVRSREYGLSKSEKDRTHLNAEHSSKKVEMEADVNTAEFSAQVAKREVEEAVDHAEDRARHRRERLEEMEEQLAGGELRASQAGVVVLGTTWDEMGMRRLREGDRIWRRMNVAEVTDLSDLQVRLRVEESAAGSIKVGQDALIAVTGVAGREFKGKVANIGAVARQVFPWEDSRAATDQRVFDVNVTLLDPDPKVLRPGMTAKAQFVSARLPDVISVPLSAVFERPEGQTVYVTASEGFTPRRVETGKRNDEAVVITKGLEPGERVALSDPTRSEAD